MHTINNDEKEMREDDIRPGPSIQNIVCVDIANVISRVWLILSLSQNTICACYNMNVTCMITSDIIPTLLYKFKPHAMTYHRKTFIYHLFEFIIICQNHDALKKLSK